MRTAALKGLTKRAALASGTSFATIAMMLMAAAPASAGCVAGGGGAIVTSDTSTVNLDTDCPAVAAPVATVPAGTTVNTDDDAPAAGSGGSAVVDEPAGLVWTLRNGGTLVGDRNGVVFFGGTIENAGTIVGQERSGVVILDAAGTVENSGTITGAFSGVFADAPATVRNSGSITGGQFGGVDLDAGGTVENAAGGTITGGFDGDAIFSRGFLTVTNAGDLVGTQFSGVSFRAGGSVDNRAGGRIFGGVDGSAIFARGGAVDITNAGLISSQVFASIFLEAGGTVSNLAGGTITGEFGIGANAAIDITNAGQIVGEIQEAIDLEAGGTVVNLAGGVITGAQEGVFVADGATSVTTAGTITGGPGSAAIDFADDDDRLELQPGFVINGDVEARGGFDQLVFGGTGAETFDVSLIDTDGVRSPTEQYFGFDAALKEDDSVFTLVGSNDVATTLPVNGGALLVNGSLPNVFFPVAAGATLGGSGTIGFFEALAGSTISPGGALDGPGSIGTLSVTNDVVFRDDSNFRVEIREDGLSDLLLVGGDATIEGGTVRVRPVQGAFTDGQIFTILSAGTLTGNFDRTQDNLTFLDFSTINNGLGDLLLVVDRVPFETAARTSNQAAVAVALNGLGATPGSDSAVVLGELLFGDEARLRAAADLISGEVHASTQKALAESGTLFAETLRRRAGLMVGLGAGAPAVEPLAYAMRSETTIGPFTHGADLPDAVAPVIVPAATSRGYEAWAAVYGGQSEYDGDGGTGVGAASLDTDELGVAAGVEANLDSFLGFSDGFTLGLAGGYSEGEADVVERRSDAEISSAHVGIYTASSYGRLHVATASSYSWHEVETARRIRFGAIDRLAEADYDASTFASSGEAQYRFGLGGFTVAPLVAYNYAHVETDGFVETGAGALNLTVLDEDYSSGSVSGGVALAYEELMGATRFRTDLRLAYEHGLGDDRPETVAALAGAPLSRFTVRGPEAGSDEGRFAVGAGIGAVFSEAVTMSARYDGSFGEDSESHRAHVSLGYRF